MAVQVIQNRGTNQFRVQFGHRDGKVQVIVTVRPKLSGDTIKERADRARKLAKTAAQAMIAEIKD